MIIFWGCIRICQLGGMVQGPGHGDLACRRIHEDIVYWLHVDDQGWHLKMTQNTTADEEQPKAWV